MNKFNNTWIVDDDNVYVFGLKVLMNSVKFSDKIEVYGDGFQAFNQL